MASGQLHEAIEDLTAETREMHRALASLMEELEAIDWYGQRVDATTDEELKKILIHNRDEEKEHACMTLEWIRRRDETFDHFLRHFLFRSGSIIVDEEDSRPTPGSDTSVEGSVSRESKTLGIGSLRRDSSQPD